MTISVQTDDTAHTISIADSGLGMTRDELIENLGTIAHSGSKAFLQQIKENAGNRISSDSSASVFIRRSWWPRR